MKKYVKPMMESEAFVANEYITACWTADCELYDILQDVDIAAIYKDDGDKEYNAWRDTEKIAHNYECNGKIKYRTIGPEQLKIEANAFQVWLWGLGSVTPVHYNGEHGARISSFKRDKVNWS